MNKFKNDVAVFNFVDIKTEQSESEGVIENNYNCFEVEEEVILNADELVFKQEEIEHSDTFLEKDSDCSGSSHCDSAEIKEKDFDDISNTSIQVLDKIAPFNHSAFSQKVSVSRGMGRTLVDGTRKTTTNRTQENQKQRGFDSLSSEYNSFGLFLAASLKNLPIENAISAQMAIMSILTNEKRKAVFSKVPDDSHHYL